MCIKGRFRIWGSSDLRRWLPLDMHRPMRSTLITLDVPAHRQRPAFTPARPGEFTALLAALDSIFGALKAYIAGTFEPRVFFSGLLTNMTLAAGLVYFGDKLGVDLSIAAIVGWGTPDRAARARWVRPAWARAARSNRAASI